MIRLLVVVGFILAVVVGECAVVYFVLPPASVVAKSAEEKLAKEKKAEEQAEEAEPDEPLEDAPVACPHCWQVGKVQIARSASIGRDYRADKI